MSNDTAYIVVPIIVVLLFYGLYRLLRSPRPEVPFSALPLDGPMKVNLVEKEVQGLNTKRIPWSLEIDVQMSQHDWKAIAAMGIMEHTLFMYPGAFNNTEDEPFPVKALRNKTYIGFQNVPQMKEAKEQLIGALHSLRAQIDEQRSGPKKETFEI